MNGERALHVGCRQEWWDGNTVFFNVQPKYWSSFQIWNFKFQPIEWIGNMLASRLQSNVSITIKNIGCGGNTCDQISSGTTISHTWCQLRLPMEEHVGSTQCWTFITLVLKRDHFSSPGDFVENKKQLKLPIYTYIIFIFFTWNHPNICWTVPRHHIGQWAKTSMDSQMLDDWGSQEAFHANTPQHHPNQSALWAYHRWQSLVPQILVTPEKGCMQTTESTKNKICQGTRLEGKRKGHCWISTMGFPSSSCPVQMGRSK